MTIAHAPSSRLRNSRVKTDGEDGAELEEGRDISDEVRIVAASASGVGRQSL